MMRFSLGAIISLACALNNAVAVSAVAVTVTKTSGDIKLSSSIGQHLMQHARRVESSDEGLDGTTLPRILGNNDVDVSFIADYSIKFQGCHHVSQWNADAEQEDDVRIRTKRLVRFRLCPSDSCQSNRSAGCSSKYGDYVVDLNTFVTSYLQAVQDDRESICYETTEECQQSCNNGGDEECMSECYDDYHMTELCLADDDNNDGGFDPADYSYCAQVDIEVNGRRRLGDDYEYYLGPYCAEQGGEIHLGLFTDDTCTTYAQNGETTFYEALGFELPYSDSSLVSSMCLKCQRGNNGNDNNDNNDNIRDLCGDTYLVSGKCETKMSVEYPNESACTYIEGIKIIREDGVIRTSAVKKSKAAAVCIGLFLTVAVLLAGYVYYLRTKLGRARINLAAASQATLT